MKEIFYRKASLFHANQLNKFWAYDQNEMISLIVAHVELNFFTSLLYKNSTSHRIYSENFKLKNKYLKLVS